MRLAAEGPETLEFLLSFVFWPEINIVLLTPDPTVIMKQSLFLILSLSCLSATCQKNTSEEDVHASLVQGKQKSLIAYAGKEHSFTMEISAATVKPSDIPGFININKQIVQSTLVPVAKDVDLHSLTTAREKEVLTKYMNYELGYYKKKLKQEYSHLETEWITIHDRLFLLWYFDMPKNYKLVNRQIYLSTIFFDQVMDLNAPVFKLDDFGKARGIVLKLANTLQVYNQHIDLGALSKQLNKGK